MQSQYLRFIASGGAVYIAGLLWLRRAGVRGSYESGQAGCQSLYIFSQSINSRRGLLTAFLQSHGSKSSSTHIRVVCSSRLGCLGFLVKLEIETVLSMLSSAL